VLQVRAVSLSNYVDVAKSCGVDGGALLRSRGIRTQDLRDPEFRLAARPVVDLLDETALVAGVDSFGLQLARSRTFSSLGPLSLLLQHLPNLRSVIEVMAAASHTISDVLLIELQDDGEVATVRFDLHPEVFGVQALDLQLALAYITLVGASQGQWHPETVCLMHSRPLDHSSFQRCFRAPLQFDCHYSGFVCATRSLDRPLPLSDITLAAHARKLLASFQRTPPIGISERVRQAITLLLPQGRATLEVVAHNLHLHPRALQRQLAIENHSFGALLNDVRRELARTYLANSARSLTEVATDLGYAKQSALSRWFAAEFGSSPSAWRLGQLRH
jgi:AraC-like DNA-binding protein